MAKRIFLIVLVVFCGTLTVHRSMAQQMAQKPATDKEIELRLPDPEKAAIYSAALPGLGQAYNRSYWKIPVIYGAAVGLGYAIKYNNTYYQQFREDLLRSHNGMELIHFPTLSQQAITSQTDRFRRNRDLLYICGGLLYLLNIVDAHVDAHLQEFKLYDDMKMKVEPTMLDNEITAAPSLGVKVKMNLNNR